MAALADGRFAYVEAASQHLYMERARALGRFALLHGGTVLAFAPHASLALMALLCPSDVAPGPSGLTRTDEARTVVHVYKCARDDDSDDNNDSDDVLTDLVTTVETHAATTLTWVSNSNSNGGGRARHFLVASSARAARTTVFECHTHKTGAVVLRTVADDACIYPCVVLGYLALFDAQSSQQRVLLWSLPRNKVEATCSVAPASAAAAAKTTMQRRREMRRPPPPASTTTTVPVVAMCAAGAFVLLLHTNATVRAVHVTAGARYCRCALLPLLSDFVVRAPAPRRVSDGDAHTPGHEREATITISPTTMRLVRGRHDTLAEPHVAAAAAIASSQRLWVGVSMPSHGNNNDSASGVPSRLVLYTLHTNDRRGGSHSSLVAVQAVTLRATARLLALTSQRALLCNVAPAHEQQQHRRTTSSSGGGDVVYEVMQLYDAAASIQSGSNNNNNNSKASACVDAVPAATTTTTATARDVRSRDDAPCRAHVPAASRVRWSSAATAAVIATVAVLVACGVVRWRRVRTV